MPIEPIENGDLGLEVRDKINLVITHANSPHVTSVVGRTDSVSADHIAAALDLLLGSGAWRTGGGAGAVTSVVGETGEVTAEQISNALDGFFGSPQWRAAFPSLSPVATSGSYGDLTNRPAFLPSRFSAVADSATPTLQMNDAEYFDFTATQATTWSLASTLARDEAVLFAAGFDQHEPTFTDVMWNDGTPPDFSTLGSGMVALTFVKIDAAFLGFLSGKNIS
ncbi:MAG: hypothetical protein AAFR84_01175 [Pseudomonadota bacterium]